MSIRYAILGFLSWKPFAGYDLKKLLSNSLSFHWSGNNNQVYGTLLASFACGASLRAQRIFHRTRQARCDREDWKR